MLLDLHGPEPLQVKLYRALRTDIVRGKLPPGARLPSTRALAAEAGVARNTVARAYDQLLGEGYAVARRGSGTYVASELPDDMTGVAGPPARALSPRRRAAPRLSRYGQRIRGWRAGWNTEAPPVAHDFRYGRPAFDEFPYATWRRLLARRARTAAERDLDYGPPAGVPALREAIAGYLQRARGVACEPAQVIVVGGSQQGIDLAARVLLDPGDRVLLEEPHYPGARGTFLAAGARLVPAPVDADGVDVGALRSAARGVRVAYVTPSHQFPTGVVMSLARRLALLGWADREGAHVLEDDYDSEYRYTGRPVQALQGLDGSGRVVYTGTFSKLMFPALRLGYVVLPPPLVEPFVTAKALADTGTATLAQLALADFIREGHFERHIRRSRARNAARRAALLAALAEHFGDRLEVSGASAGIHVLVWLRDVSPRRLPSYVARARETGVGIYPVAPCFLTKFPRAGLILGYTAMTAAGIRRGIERLATVLR